jgi:hypothetical protein
VDYYRIVLDQIITMKYNFQIFKLNDDRFSLGLSGVTEHNVVNKRWEICWKMHSESTAENKNGWIFENTI